MSACKCVNSKAKSEEGYCANIPYSLYKEYHIENILHFIYKFLVIEYHLRETFTEHKWKNILANVYIYLGE